MSGSRSESQDGTRSERGPDGPPSGEPGRVSALTSADPPRNFTLTVEERVRAMTIGAPAYATRKKAIEDQESGWIRTLVGLHAVLARRADASEESIARALLDKASTFDFRKANARIEVHNRYYPIEANLAMDSRTGGYLVYGNPWSPEEPFTPARLVERARAVIRERDDL